MQPPGELIRIDANGKTTEMLVGEILTAFNDGNRATFLCAPGDGERVIQRIRMKLSRTRTAMEAKGRAKQHFNLRAEHYPYTNRDGKRFDCVVCRKVVRPHHSIFETLEGIALDALTGGHARTKVQPATERVFEW